MADKNKIRIKIFGTEYLLKGDSDPAYMRELADLVDQRMRAHGQPGSVQTNRVAILTAFQFADELLKARRALDSERQNYDQAARKVAELDLKIQEALKAQAEEGGEDGSMLLMEEAREEEAPGEAGNSGDSGESSDDSDDDSELNWK